MAFSIELNLAFSVDPVAAILVEPEHCYFGVGSGYIVDSFNRDLI